MEFIGKAVIGIAEQATAVSTPEPEDGNFWWRVNEWPLQ
jgi:hypothetical protein